MEDITTNHHVVHLVQLTQQTLRDIRQSLKALRLHLDEKEVHRLRLAIKRLRVILALLRELDGGRKKTHRLHQVIRQLFRCAGPLRDAQVLLGLLLQEKGTGVQLLLPEVNKDVRREEKNFKKCIHDVKPQSVKMHGTMKTWLISFPTVVILEAMDQLQGDYLHNIRKELERNREESIHDIRTALKRLVELNKIKVVLGYVSHPEVLWDDAKRLAQRIGEWHDIQVMYQYAQSSLLNAAKGAIRDPIGKRLARSYKQQMERRGELENEVVAWLERIDLVFAHN